MTTRGFSSGGRWRSVPVLTAVCIAALAARGLADEGLGSGAAEPSRQQLIEEFRNARLVPANGSFLFVPGEFPKMEWESPLLVDRLWGPAPLTVRWFDAAGEEVTTAAQPGRYAAYIEARPPGGPVIRRAKTFYCMDRDEAVALLQGPHPEMPEFSLPGVSRAAWKVHRELFAEFVGKAVWQALGREDDAAILIGGAAEWDREELQLGPLDTPSVRHQEHHLAVRRRILGLEGVHPPLRLPARRAVIATTLHEGPTSEAGFEDNLPDRLQALCEKWLGEEGKCFTLVVARRGVVVFHQAFGQRRGEAVTRDTAYPLFSITKSISGLMLAQFLDQGLLDLDAPLGRVLPDFPSEGPGVMTLRQCMMHTTGLSGQSNWGGLNNPWMDNVVANGLETHKPAYRYSGVALDLAGFAMQTVSGKSIPRVFHEHFFEPLEMRNASITGLGIGASLRAIDLARAGQMLLNRGAYGPYTFFSEETAEQVMPQPYADHFPDVNANREAYGLGIRWAPGRHPQAGQDGRPADATILGSRTVGHGSASGSIFRVDPDNEIVIAMGRFEAGREHGRYVVDLLMTVAGSAHE